MAHSDEEPNERGDEAVRPGGDRASDKRAQGALESEVLAALWAEGQPMTAGAVQACLGHDLAYNTVQTTLIRLLDKGLVQREKSGRAHAYRPTRDEAALTAQRMVAHLVPGADHAAVLAQFLSTLDPADAVVLRGLLAAQDSNAPAEDESDG